MLPHVLMLYQKQSSSDTHELALQRKVKNQTYWPNWFMSGLKITTISLKPCTHLIQHFAHKRTQRFLRNHLPSVVIDIVGSQFVYLHEIDRITNGYDYIITRQLHAITPIQITISIHIPQAGYYQCNLILVITASCFIFVNITLHQLLFIECMSSYATKTTNIELLLYHLDLLYAFNMYICTSFLLKRFDTGMPHPTQQLCIIAQLRIQVTI